MWSEGEGGRVGYICDYHKLGKSSSSFCRSLRLGVVVEYWVVEESVILDGASSVISHHLAFVGRSAWVRGFFCETP